MLCRKKDSQAFSIAGGSEGVLYPSSPRGDQTVAVVTTDGIYPESGYSYNDVCTETLLLLDGRLTVEVDGTVHEMFPDDLLMIFPGQKYRLWGKGRTVDLISPAWDKKQNHIIK